MHAYGHTHRPVVVIERLPMVCLKPPVSELTVEEAMKLQRQLGVAIREAVGQTSIEALDNPGIGTIPLG